MSDFLYQAATFIPAAAACIAMGYIIGRNSR